MTATTRRTPRLRPIHFVLSLLLALAGVVAISAPAHATADTIEGTVSTPANTAGINVYLSQELTAGTGPAFTGSPLPTTTDGAGYFAFTGVADGDYLLIIDGGDDWVQSVLFVTVAAPADPTFFSIFSGPMTAPVLVDLEPGVAISGTVKDAEAPFNTLAGITVYATAGASFFPFFDWLTMDLDYPGFPGAPRTGPSGAYSFVVPLDDEYEVTAVDLDDAYGEQNWYHHNVGFSTCGCDRFDPISIPDSSGWPHAPIIGTDFDLLNTANWIDISVLADDLNGDPLEGVLIHLDRKTGPATWDLDIDTELTDVDGYADVFALGDGDYRLRYSVGGVFKAIDSWYEVSFPSWPLSDSGFSVELDGLLTGGCGCGYSVYDPELVFPLAPSGGGGSTPAKPRKPHTTFSSFTLPTPSATPTPTPTPTSTPSPSSSPSESPSATPEPTDQPEPTGNVFTDIWWLWLLLAAILALIVFFLVRLIRGRP